VPRTSTPATGIVENFDDDVGLGGDTSSEPATVANYSATENVPVVIIYTHGCSARLKINLAEPDALRALARCGWSADPPQKVWRSSRPGPGIRRYVVRGSKWLDERPPKNQRLPLVGLNRRWKTHLYSLAVEIKDHKVHVDLQVVRHDDIRQFMEGLLGVGKTDYTTVYYRTIERFMVLPPHEAFRLAEQLDAIPKNGGGRLARKRYLVQDHEIEIPIIIRKRTKATANLVVYRIDRGATAHYKVEVRLRGRRRDRGEFHEKDIEKLDNVLLDLVTKYDLKTIPKPARWEPRTFTTAVERGPFDPYIKQIPEKAWRGRRVPEGVKRTVRDCHTPGTVRLVACAREPGTFPPPARIRSAFSTPPGPSVTVNDSNTSVEIAWKCVEKRGVEVARYINQQNQQQGEVQRPEVARDPWSRIVHDIDRSRLYLHEVVLDPEQSPGPLLHALARGVLGKIGVAAICAVDSGGHADTWQSVIAATKERPFEGPDLDTLVIVIDVSAVRDVASAVVGGLEPMITDDGEIVGDLDTIFTPGPLMPPEPPPEFSGPRKDALPALFTATGAWLDNLFLELRRLGEETGVRIVAVTCDGRTDGGTGPMRRNHYFTDKRVRSTIGDAGRQHSHMRYLVERVRRTRWVPGYKYEVQEGHETIIHEHVPHEDYEHVVGNIIAIKDEAEGLPGRIIYEAPVQPERPRWHRKKPL
jgi:hypothetical protein